MLDLLTPLGEHLGPAGSGRRSDIRAPSHHTIITSLTKLHYRSWSNYQEARMRSAYGRRLNEAGEQVGPRKSSRRVPS